MSGPIQQNETLRQLEWQLLARNMKKLGGGKKTEIRVHFCRFNKSSKYFYKGASVSLLT